MADLCSKVVRVVCTFSDIKRRSERLFLFNDGALCKCSLQNSMFKLCNKYNGRNERDIKLTQVIQYSHREVL